MIKRKTPFKQSGLKPLGIKPSGLKPSGLAQSGIKSGGLRSSGISNSKSPNASRKGDKNQHEKDKAFYLMIWEKKPHICESCGACLGSELCIMYPEHLLDKAVYPEFRYVEENIALVCFDCHTVKTNGWPRPGHQILIDKAKKLLL